MKQTHILFSTFLLIYFLFDQTFAGYLFPAPECVKTSKGHYDGKMLAPLSNIIRCRTGQRMKIVTSTEADMETKYCCCNWDETSVQTSKNELKFYANRCEFEDNDSKVPIRESLMVHGNDLYCFRDEKLTTFKAEINGKIQAMSCCKSIPRTTTTEHPTTTQSTQSDAQSQMITQNQTPTPQPPSNTSQKDDKITLLESQKAVISILQELTKTDIEDIDDAILQFDTSPVPHIKLRGNENSVPPLQTKKKSVPKVEFVLNSLFVKDPVNQNNVVQRCCRYSSAHYLTSSVFTFLVCFVVYVCAYCLFVFS